MEKVKVVHFGLFINKVNDKENTHTMGYNAQNILICPAAIKW